jgi:hypothetical protein
MRMCAAEEKKMIEQRKGEEKTSKCKKNNEVEKTATLYLMIGMAEATGKNSIKNLKFSQRKKNNTSKHEPISGQGRKHKAAH